MPAPIVPAQMSSATGQWAANYLAAAANAANAGDAAASPFQPAQQHPTIPQAPISMPQPQQVIVGASGTMIQVGGAPTQLRYT